MYLLDTNVISEIRKIKQNKANPNLVTWLSNVQVDSLYTNVVVLMEIEKGILNIRRKDSLQAKNLERWFETAVKDMFQGRILKVDERTASICAKLHIPNPSPENDSWISASAIQHNLILVTRNTKDFDNPYLDVFNPFD